MKIKIGRVTLQNLHFGVMFDLDLSLAMVQSKLISLRLDNFGDKIPP